MESKLAWRSNHGVTPLHLLGSVHKYIGAWSFFRRDNISENRQEPLRCGLLIFLHFVLLLQEWRNKEVVELRQLNIDVEQPPEKSGLLVVLQQQHRTVLLCPSAQVPWCGYIAFQVVVLHPYQNSCVNPDVVAQLEDVGLSFTTKDYCGRHIEVWNPFDQDLSD
ncbi:hypothetical protein L1049_027224 [Liquidambar formosana]|uniref:Uncharacterized protein n=1 Tax=Liquidambar formosana TaxID=63359 RepID=A0AAP0N634_LIQFO